MALYNNNGGYLNSMMFNDAPELRYTFGNTQVPEMENIYDVYKIHEQIRNNQYEQNARYDELTRASELAKNHPATNAGLLTGNIAGHIGAYALANSLPKWFPNNKNQNQFNLKDWANKNYSRGIFYPGNNSIQNPLRLDFKNWF